mgnify:CR=1 FL=1
MSRTSLHFCCGEIAEVDPYEMSVSGGGIWSMVTSRAYDLAISGIGKPPNKDRGSPYVHIFTIILD